jgi:hypothetical protein
MLHAKPEDKLAVKIFFIHRAGKEILSWSSVA